VQERATEEEEMDRRRTKKKLVSVNRPKKEASSVYPGLLDKKSTPKEG
jgi:hypothetical protein